MIKITPVTRDGNIAESEIVQGNFNTILIGLGHEIYHAKTFRFVVLTKVS